jgi:AcrR family transcriptional regulator
MEIKINGSKQKMEAKTRIERIRSASSLRREKEKQELHSAILNSAAQLFLEKGYDGFSMRQVAEQIGYSATTIYLYFEDKDDLLFSVVDQAYERFSRDLQAAYDSALDPVQCIYNLGRAYVDFGLENPVAYQLIFMQRPDFLTRWSTGSRKPRPLALLIFQQAVSRAAEAGAIHTSDTESQADALWASVHGLVALSISMPMFNQKRIAKAVDCALDILVAGMRT